jgi:hypothetical protein
MKARNRLAAITLAKGQVFKVDDNYLEIVGIGKHLTHYKLSASLKQRGVPTRLGGIHDVEKYLKTKKAKLIKEDKAIAEPAERGR